MKRASSVLRAARRRALSSTHHPPSHSTAPHATLSKRSATPREVSLLGAPFASGQPLPGTDLGPDALRAAGLADAVRALGAVVHDEGNLAFTPGEDLRAAGLEDSPDALNSQEVGAACRVIAGAVEDGIRAGRFALTLGGDHSVGIGTVAGALRARPDASVVWVDAHADLNTPESSASKNLHGMALAFHVRGMLERRAEVPGFEWLADDQPTLHESRLVFIGLRDLDPFEQHWLRRSGARVFTMNDIDRHGIGKVMEMTMEHLDRVNRGGPVHLSVDIDSVDPFLAPSTGTVVRGGLSYRESNYICEAFSDYGQLLSMDLVELNPTLDPKGAKSTAELGIQMVCSALGQRIL